MNNNKYKKHAMRAIASGILPIDGIPVTLDLLGLNFSGLVDNVTDAFQLGFTLSITPLDNYDISVTGKNINGVTITEIFNTADIVASGLPTYFTTHEFQSIDNIVIDNYSNVNGVTSKLNITSVFDIEPYLIDKDLIYCRNFGNIQTLSFNGDSTFTDFDPGVPANTTANGDPNLFIKTFATGGDDDIKVKLTWTNLHGVQKTSEIDFVKDELFWHKMEGREGIDNVKGIKVEVKGKFGNAGDGFISTYAVANTVGNIGNYSKDYKFLMTDFAIAKDIIDANPSLSSKLGTDFTFSVLSVAQEVNNPSEYVYMRIGYEGQSIDLPDAGGHAVRINTKGVDDIGPNPDFTRYRDLSPKDYFQAHSNDPEEYTNFKINHFAFLGNVEPTSGKIHMRINSVNKEWFPTGDIAIFDITTGKATLVITDDGDSYQCTGWFDISQDAIGQMFVHCIGNSGADIVFSRDFISKNSDRFLVINVNGLIL